MLDHTSADMEPALLKVTESTIAKGDVSRSNFEKEYLTGHPTASRFWVAEVSGSGVIGCVGLKRTPGYRDEAELVRMAVSSSLRGGGVGSRLVAELLSYCSSIGALRVTVYTANPSAASFYEHRCGFINIKGPSEKKLGSGAVQFFSGVRYLGERLIRRIAILGGTHGNERLGVELVRQWEQDPSLLARPTLKASRYREGVAEPRGAS